MLNKSSSPRPYGNKRKTFLFVLYLKKCYLFQWIISGITLTHPTTIPILSLSSTIPSKGQSSWEMASKRSESMARSVRSKLCQHTAYNDAKSTTAFLGTFFPNGRNGGSDYVPLESHYVPLENENLPLNPLKTTLAVEHVSFQESN